MGKRKIRLLIVEDEEYDVRRIKSTIKSHNRIEICDIVSSGDEAIKLVSKKEDYYDVAILDYQIAGGLLGEKLIKEIKRINPTLQIIVITKMTINQYDFDFANSLLEAGAFWFYTKYPSDIDSYIYQPTDFILGIVNAYEKKQLELERNNSHNKLNKGVQNLLLRKNIVGNSYAIQELKEKIKEYADTDANVIIYGESGTGKELIAMNIHYLSKRKFENFVPINCGCMPRELIESELFGYEKGSFTGAKGNKSGLFEQADGGTIFLDEISEFPFSAQAKLLRALESGEIDKIGREKNYKVNVRVVAATNKDLREMVAKKKFREDLYYRLNVLQIYIPPLRERKEDIPVLIDYYQNKYSAEMGKVKLEFGQKAFDILKDYPWLGNVRELQNFIQRLLLMNRKTVTEDIIADVLNIKWNLEKNHSNPSNFDKGNILPLRETVKRFEKKYIQFVRNRSITDADAANKLGIAPPNYYRICKELGLK
jgi:DNA-binding NtrC family response regulator